ncbi:hypothetical protein DFR76_101546 [Nocardia pseudobrasiliensis]|uniref:DUF6286 domain-containing protein n=1 Tax=Nocardia pseudobrasiliensis TaxID=45979 RepID=A0A370IE66_9NOCA|nr:DUF6286 domain-containing protein [Nocardia pseudobrasiliensis]RDI69009.1 hypothetical protein DFR76_101546 [Nocardia pseudobrasiliensis]
MRRRSRRVIPAVLVALTLLAVSVAVAVSLIQRLSGAREFISYDTVATQLHDLTWASGWVLGVGIAAVALGLLLFGIALWPGRAVVVPLAAEDEVSAGIARRSLRGAVDDAAAAVTGVESSRVRLGRKKIRIKGRARRAEDLNETVRAAVEHRLRRIAPAALPNVEAALRPTRNSARAVADVSAEGRSAGAAVDVSAEGRSAGAAVDVSAAGRSAGAAVDVSAAGRSAGAVAEVPAEGRSAGAAVDVSDAGRSAEAVADVPAAAYSAEAVAGKRSGEDPTEEVAGVRSGRNSARAVAEFGAVGGAPAVVAEDEAVLRPTGSEDVR